MNAHAHGEHLVLEALAEPGTRWHQPSDLVTATGLRALAVDQELERLRERGLATGPPQQPAGTGWSITTNGDALLRALEKTADLLSRLEAEPTQEVGR